LANGNGSVEPIENVSVFILIPRVKLVNLLHSLLPYFIVLRHFNFLVAAKKKQQKKKTTHTLI